MQVTDLRTLAYQMQFDTTMDYRSMLLVAPVSERAEQSASTTCRTAAPHDPRASAVRTHVG